MVIFFISLASLVEATISIGGYVPGTGDNTSFNQTLTDELYLNQSEAGDLFVNITGDTMTGNLTIIGNLTVDGQSNYILGSDDANGVYINGWGDNKYIGSSNTGYGLYLLREFKGTTTTNNPRMYGMYYVMKSSQAQGGQPLDVNPTNYGAASFMTVDSQHNYAADDISQENNYASYSYLLRNGTVYANTPFGYLSETNIGTYSYVMDKTKYDNATGTMQIANYGGQYTVNAANHQIVHGGMSVVSTGFLTNVAGEAEGNTTNIAVAGISYNADINYFLYNGHPLFSSLSADNWIAKDDDKTYFGNAQDAYLEWDGSNFVINPGSGLIYGYNFSGTDFVTRTAVYDTSKGSALDKVKDADSYIDLSGNINHSKFYGYLTMNVTNQSSCKNVTITLYCLQHEEYVPTFEIVQIGNITYMKTTPENVTDRCEDTLNPDWKNYQVLRTQKERCDTMLEPGVSTSEHNAMLEQAIYELKQQVQSMNQTIIDHEQRLKVLEGIRP